ncbi:MarR family winged helix-turn-helix transcriptional regulator [Georgenia sunbinii]|uniref:MarR family winged helix-turn-helix transcriptional regulator n=1 Tax=Georgenia sunbinii TaxID=3117728 RepID=UPI002F26B554
MTVAGSTDAEGDGEEGATRPTIAYPSPEKWPTGRLLSAAARRVERAWDAYLLSWDLSHASVPVLVVLARGPLSQRQVAAQMHVTEQAVGRVVRNLERSGHVTRQRHPADRRRQVVALTPSGRQSLTTLDDAHAVESLIGDSLSPAQIDQLRGLLIELVTAMPLTDERDTV